MPPFCTMYSYTPNLRVMSVTFPLVMKINRLCVCEHAVTLVSKNSKQHVNGAVVTGESSSLSLSPRLWCPGGWLTMNQPQGNDEHPACSLCHHPRYRKAPSHMTFSVLMA